MAKPTQSETPAMHTRNEKPVESELGRKLRRISDKMIASGEKLLTRREIEREMARRRGGLRSSH